MPLTSEQIEVQRVRFESEFSKRHANDRPESLFLKNTVGDYIDSQVIPIFAS